MNRHPKSCAERPLSRSPNPCLAAPQACVKGFRHHHFLTGNQGNPSHHPVRRERRSPPSWARFHRPVPGRRSKGFARTLARWGVRGCTDLEFYPPALEGGLTLNWKPEDCLFGPGIVSSGPLEAAAFSRDRENFADRGVPDRVPTSTEQSCNARFPLLMSATFARGVRR